MVLSVQFTPDEYLAWLREWDAKFATGKYDDHFPDNALVTFIHWNYGPLGELIFHDGQPMLDIGEYNNPTLLRLPGWTTALAATYISARTGVETPAEALGTALARIK